MSDKKDSSSNNLNDATVNMVVKNTMTLLPHKSGTSSCQEE
jgi:hypothetical protein